MQGIHHRGRKRSIFSLVSAEIYSRMCSAALFPVEHSRPSNVSTVCWGGGVVLEAQSKELERKSSTACSKFDMVWLYRWLYCSPIPVGRRGVISSFKWFLPAFATRRRGRGRLPVVGNHFRAKTLHDVSDQVQESTKMAWSPQDKDLGGDRPQIKTKRFFVVFFEFFTLLG